MTKAKTRLAYMGAGVAVVIWGATPAATAIVARELSPGLIGLARLLLSATILIPIAVSLKPELPSDRGGWIALLISALVGFAGSFVLQGVGIARTSTSHAALVLALAPIFTATVHFLLSRCWPRPLWWLGSAIALMGVAILIPGRNPAGSVAAPTLFGDLLVLAGTVTVSVGYVAGARLSARIGLFAATCWSLLLAGLITLPAFPALAAGLGQLSFAVWGALGFLAVFCTLIGFAVWFWALEHGGVTSIAPLQFGQPLVSLVIAVAFLSEDIFPATLLALSLVILGVHLSRRAA